MNWKEFLKHSRRKVLLALVLVVPSYFLSHYFPLLSWPLLIIHFGSAGLLVKLVDVLGISIPFGTYVFSQLMTLLYVFSVSYLLSCIVIFVVGKVRE